MKTTLRTALAAAALAAATLAGAQTTTSPGTDSNASSQGQRSVEEQDRGAMRGTAGVDAARDLSMEAREQRARMYARKSITNGQLSVPNQDRGGYAGLGDERAMNDATWGMHSPLR